MAARSYFLFLSASFPAQAPGSTRRCAGVARFHYLSRSISSSSRSTSRTARMAASQTASPIVKDQKFDYFLVLDFEATCDDKKKMNPQEIIEFPVLKFNWRTFTVESEFHQYVQPRVHRELSPFCVELTGILQDMVDNQPHIEETLDKFDAWMKREVLEKNASYTFVTCGDWDLKTMLPSQCRYFKITPKPYFRSWINIKKAFAEATGTYPKGMMPMLQMLRLPHQGRHHSGIDDCTNIVSLLKALLERGHLFSNTGFLHTT